MSTWKELRKKFKCTEEEEEEIKLEKDIISAITRLREENELSQRKLSELSGIPKTTIARIETNVVTPQLSTLIKYLNTLGYRLEIVPKGKNMYCKNKRVSKLMVSEDNEEYNK